MPLELVLAFILGGVFASFVWMLLSRPGVDGELKHSRSPDPMLKMERVSRVRPRPRALKDLKQDAQARDEIRGQFVDFLHEIDAPDFELNIEPGAWETLPPGSTLEFPAKGPR